MPWASLLGNGWYNHQSGALCGTSSGRRGATARRSASTLRIEYADGTHEVVKSDLDWRTSGGPLVFNSIYTSEHYDARLEQPGLERPRVRRLGLGRGDVPRRAVAEGYGTADGADPQRHPIQAAQRAQARRTELPL